MVNISRFGICAKYIPKLYFATRLGSNQLFMRSRNFSTDSTTAADAKVQRKIELNEQIGVDRLQRLFDDEIKDGDIVPVFKRALLYGNKIAIKDDSGEYSYRQLIDAALKLSVALDSYGNVCLRFVIQRL